jgi:hypothetical protein
MHAYRQAMTSNAESLRLSVGLVHAVPGAELRLTTTDDQVVVISTHPGADLDPCAMRRTVLASACPAKPDLSRWISAVDIGGSLKSCGAGLYRARSGLTEQRWFASLLRPERVLDLLEAVDVSAVPDDALLASVRPDPALGMSSVCISVAAPCLEKRMDEIASAAYAACLIEELTLECQRA